MRILILLALICLAHSQKSKIGINSNFIVSSDSFNMGYSGYGLYFQRSAGILDYGVNLNYATYHTIKEDIFLPLSSIFEFMLFTKLRVDITNNISVGPGLAFGANIRLSLHTEFKLYQSLFLNTSYEYVDRNFINLAHNFHDMGQYYGFRFIIYFEL